MSARLDSPLLDRTQESWLLACSAVSLMPNAVHTPAWLIAAACTTLAWRSAVLWRRGTLPPRWLLFVFVAAGSAGVFFTYRHFFGKDPGIALLTLFLALKLLELRRIRDGMAVILLCYFLLLTHFLNAQGIGVAGLTLIAVITITAALASLGHPARPVADRLRLSLLLLGQAVPFMLVMFLLFPRVQGPLWGMPADAYSSMSGLSDSMSPGSISSLSLSSEIAFRAKFEGRIPPKQALYWRGPVLRMFDGYTWRVGIQQEKASISDMPKEAPLGDTATGTSIRYAVTLEPHNKSWLFALEMPVMSPAGAFLTRDYQVLSRTPVRNRLRYEMVSRTTSVQDEESAASLRAHRSLPDNNPRTRALAERWRAELDSDEAMVRRVLDHFRRENYTYTLNPPLLGQNSVDEFLFDSRRGFCEHFSAAFVVIMRAAGIPARVITGYQGGEPNPVDGYLIVRQSDAHAWAEVWLEGRGWVRVDPTAAIAPNRIEVGLASAVPAGEALPFLVRADLPWLWQIRFRWEALTNYWNQWVLGYNPQRQREVLSRMGMREPNWQTMTAIMAMLCGILLLLLTAWVLYKHVSVDPTLRAWNRLSHKLAVIGLGRRDWEGPEDYASRVASARPDLDSDISAISALYIGLRYGRLDGIEPQKKLRDMVSALKISTRK